MDDHILPECFIDTKLVTMLVPPLRGQYNHQKSNGTVGAKMQKHFSDDFAVGIIDDDKELVAYATECFLVYDCNNGLTLHKHPVLPHYFIIHPPIERWIIELVAVAGLVMRDFALPDRVEQLKDKTKTAKSDRDDPNADKFRRLFIELRRAQPLPVAVMTYWLTYLKANPYTADVAELQAETDRLLAHSSAALIDLN